MGRLSRDPNTSFSFVHTADLHLGSRIITPAGMDDEALPFSTYDAWQEIIRLSIEEKVDFLLISGDIYDNKDNNIQAQLQFAAGLKRLGEKGISAYIVHGNHDPDDGWARSVTLPDTVHISSSREPEVIDHMRDQPIARIIGMSFPTASVTENLALRFPKRERDWPYTIGLLHCTVGGMEGHHPYAPCSRGDLISLGYDYFALGHIHKPADLSYDGTRIIYPGNPQGRDMGETGWRGCCLVRVGVDGSTEVTHHPTARYIFKEISVDITGINDIGGIEELIRLRLPEAQKDLNCALICRVILTGITGIHATLTGRGGIEALIKRFREDSPVGEASIHIDQIIQKTLPKIDRDEIKSREDLLGEICRIGDVAVPGEGIFALLKKEIQGISDSSVGSDLSSFDDLQVQEIVSEAEALLLSLLTPEETA
ncbi:DNA repair exonuclease [Methanocalculus sp.]|uniref:metallophosphoesterase family protein n=1 Tax=Methanocalculus sp. TaxID=2004547 RepID=UPI00271AB7B1|nr:DNA repair exonuclease [Methanocalculus sp.]MDO8841546.1 DNA repair exonuclease [Methanocalculus sp.]